MSIGRVSRRKAATHREWRLRPPFDRPEVGVPLRRVADVRREVGNLRARTGDLDARHDVNAHPAKLHHAGDGGATPRRRADDPGAIVMQASYGNDEATRES